MAFMGDVGFWCESVFDTPQAREYFRLAEWSMLLIQAQGFDDLLFLKDTGMQHAVQVSCFLRAARNFGQSHQSST